jgi:hypothetical protein
MNCACIRQASIAKKISAFPTHVWLWLRIICPYVAIYSLESWKEQ